jgi:hypothetical protein
MNMPGRVIRMENECFYVRRAEMKYARFMVVEPDDGVKVMLAHGRCPFCRKTKKIMVTAPDERGRNCQITMSLMRGAVVLMKIKVTSPE